MNRPRIALISNPKSTGNLAQLPRIRAFCSMHPDIFHYEVERADQIGEAMKMIAMIRPSVLAINGGDGTVQAILTELFNGAHFGDVAPPVAVLPSGKTNLIALDLGAQGDPVQAQPADRLQDQSARAQQGGHGRCPTSPCQGTRGDHGRPHGDGGRSGHRPGRDLGERPRHEGTGDAGVHQFRPRPHAGILGRRRPERVILATYG